MITYLVNRIFQAFFTLLAVSLVAFVMFNFVGDPVSNMVGQETTSEDYEALREKMGLNDPTIMQFGRFVANAARGNLGISYRMQRPVADIIAERLPASLELVFVAAVFAIGLGVPLGVYTGLKRGSWGSTIVMAGSLLGVSLPTFLIGILLIYVFSVQLGWLPSFGRGATVEVGGVNLGLLTLKGWRSLILPAITLSLYQMTLIMRLCRSEMIEVLRTDYIKFALARGLTDRVVNFRHALKNTLVPVITIIGLLVGRMIAFAIVVETVFQWPGMGFLFITAVEFADIPVMASYLILVALMFVTINFIIDILYYVIDPRLKPERAISQT